jgi:hypothetical protein
VIFAIPGFLQHYVAHRSHPRGRVVPRRRDMARAPHPARHVVDPAARFDLSIRVSGLSRVQRLRGLLGFCGSKGFLF